MQKSVKIFGSTLTLHMRNEGDLAIANELFLHRQYIFCEQTIDKAKNAVIDIGGHLGFFSIYASLINPTVPIYTFEPHEGNFELLKKNLKENRLKNVFPKQLAVSNESRQSELQLSKEDLNHSLTKAIEPTGKVQQVQTTTLERIFEKNRISSCDLIKIDCEGEEFSILYATPDLIFAKIFNIFLEYHDWVIGHNSGKLKQFLEKKGFKVEKYPNNKIKELGFLWCRK